MGRSSSALALPGVSGVAPPQNVPMTVCHHTAQLCLATVTVTKLHSFNNNCSQSNHAVL